MENNLIKAITKLTCPHCEKEIYVESQMEPPTIASVFTDDQYDGAKADCLTRIETLTIDDEKKKAVVDWINDPKTIFAPSEVENIILSLLNPEQ